MKRGFHAGVATPVTYGSAAKSLVPAIKEDDDLLDAGGDKAW
jgi:hypothetical protein